MKRRILMTPLATMCLLTACGDNGADDGDGAAAPNPAMQLPVVKDDTPDFVPKDMSWMPADIWLPDDFQPRQSQKISPVAETYVLRGITQMGAAELGETISAKMVAANYEPYEMSKPKPGSLLFRGNGHGTVMITISNADTGRELVVSVENASGQ